MSIWSSLSVEEVVDIRSTVPALYLCRKVLVDILEVVLNLVAHLVKVLCQVLIIFKLSIFRYLRSQPRS